MFSTYKLWIAALALIGATTLFSGAAQAQKLAVVDGNQVLSDYSEAIKADGKLKDMGKMWQDSIKMMQESLQAKADGYRKTFETMTKEAQQKAQGEVDKMLQDVQAYQTAKFDANNGQLSQERTKLLKPILEKIKDVISSVAKKKKLDIVIDSKQSAIFVGDAVTDITKEVSAALK